MTLAEMNANLEQQAEVLLLAEEAAVTDDAPTEPTTAATTQVGAVVVETPAEVVVDTTGIVEPVVVTGAPVIPQGMIAISSEIHGILQEAGLLNPANLNLAVERAKTYRQSLIDNVNALSIKANGSPAPFDAETFAAMSDTSLKNTATGYIDQIRNKPKKVEVKKEEINMTLGVATGAF